MSIRSKIIIPSSGIVELYDDVSMSLTYQVADIKDPQKRHADYSKTITVPGTANNNKMFQMIFDIGIDRWFDTNKKVKAKLVIDSSVVMNGHMRLRGIKVNDKKIEYEIELTGRQADIFTVLGDTRLSELSWTDLNHTYSLANQAASWSTPVGNNYMYPFIDYGYSTNKTHYNIGYFFPAIYLKEYIVRIFMYAGFDWASTFFDSEFFKRLVVPFNSDNLKLTSSQIELRKFRASRLTSNQSVTAPDPPPLGTYSTTDIVFNDDTSSPNADTGSQYDTATGIFTPGTAGFYNFYAQVGLRGYATASTPTTTNKQNVLQCVVNIVDMDTMPSAHIIASTNAQEFTFVAASYTGKTQSNVGGLTCAGGTSTPIYLSVGQRVKCQVLALIVYAETNITYTAEVQFNSFFMNIVSPTISDGDTLTMSTAIPRDVKCVDLLNSVNKLFNLYWEYGTDLDFPSKIFIEPRDDYYNTTIQDWTQKRDLSKDLEIIPMGALDARKYRFKYKNDSDYLNKTYQDIYIQLKENYGTKIVVIDNDFLTEEKTEEVIFSPTPQYSDTASDRYYPRIVKQDQNGKVDQVASNLRLLYYSGLKACQQWEHISLNAGASRTTYPHVGHLDDEVGPTLDLNFGVPRKVFYTPQTNATYTNNNLYNKYWRKTINEITHKNSSLVVGYFHLKPKDIAIVDFRHVYRFDFQNFRLNKIYDFDPINDGLTKCEFIKIKDGIPFTSGTVTNNGGSDGVFAVTSESAPTQDINPFQLIGPRQGQNIIGFANQVDPSALAIEIVGSYNTVGARARNVSIINSSGCTVVGSMQNVRILNSSGVTVTESNVNYERGMITSNSRGRVKQITANETADNGEMVIFASAAPSAIAYSLPAAATYPGRIITVKKIDSSANAVTIETSAGETIDGASSKSITVQWNFYTFISNGSNWFIISN